jgi:hypothetical protein
MIGSALVGFNEIKKQLAKTSLCIQPLAVCKLGTFGGSN